MPNLGISETGQQTQKPSAFRLGFCRYLQRVFRVVPLSPKSECAGHNPRIAFPSSDRYGNRRNAHILRLTRPAGYQPKSTLYTPEYLGSLTSYKGVSLWRPLGRNQPTPILAELRWAWQLDLPQLWSGPDSLWLKLRLAIRRRWSARSTVVKTSAVIRDCPEVIRPVAPASFVHLTRLFISLGFLPLSRGQIQLARQELCQTSCHG